MKNFGVALAVGLVVVLLAIILINALSPGALELREEKNALSQQQARELAPLWLTVKRIGLVSLAVILSSAGAVAAVLAVISLATLPDVKRWARIRSWLIKPMREGAMYPALAGPDGAGHITVSRPVNEVGAQKVAALTTGLRPEVKLLGSAARAALRNDPAETVMPDEPAEPPVYAPEQIIQPDIRTKPDTLIVGAKGSGKTSALRWLIECYARAIPDAEFLIMSPISSNWNIPGVISDPLQIRDTILALRDEMGRRDDILKAARITDYHEWPDRPRPLVVVIDEAEATMEEIELAVSVREAKNFGRVLRIVVNKARNFGFAIIQGTQTARADVLDPSFMHQAGTLLMMRMDAATAARFSEYDRTIVAQLPTLPAGQAYCPQAAGFVQFPKLTELRRQPRMSKVYTPRPQLAAGKTIPQVPADAESDGLGPDDQPDSPGVILVNPGAATGSPTVVGERGGNGQNGGYGRATVVAATTPRLPMEERARRVPRDHVPNREEDQETIYEMWLSLDRNSAATQRAIYDYDGGKAYYYCAFAINRALARRGQPPRYREESK